MLLFYFQGKLKKKSSSAVKNFKNNFRSQNEKNFANDLAHNDARRSFC